MTHINKSSSCFKRESTSSADFTQTLTQRLRQAPNERVTPVPGDMLRKYIAYARKYVSPKLTPEACRVLQSFYLELRQRWELFD